MIVVSEDSRLDKTHPLARFIVFAPYEALAAKVKDVLQHYNDYYHRLFVAQSDLFDKLPTNVQRYQAAINAQTDTYITHTKT